MGLILWQRNGEMKVSDIISATIDSSQIYFSVTSAYQPPLEKLEDLIAKLTNKFPVKINPNCQGNNDTNEICFFFEYEIGEELGEEIDMFIQKELSEESIEDFNLIDDEKKQISMNQFAQILKDSVDDYVDALENQNEFTKGKHTYLEWMNAFRGYMSF